MWCEQCEWWKEYPEASESHKEGFCLVTIPWPWKRKKDCCNKFKPKRKHGDAIMEDTEAKQPQKPEIMPGPGKTIDTGRHVGVTDSIPGAEAARINPERAVTDPSEQMRENLKAKMHSDREFCVSCPKDGVCKTHLPDAEDLKESCQEMRKDLLAIGKRLEGLIKDHPECAAPEEGFTVLSRRYEIADNAILMYRHIEDARMRAGKIIQALDGGTSIYPK